MSFLFPLHKPVVPGTFIGRPQRFLAEVSLGNGTLLTAYCPNPGSFGDCLVPGSPCLLWDSQDSTRKRRYTLRAVKKGRTWIGTDTHLANGLVLQAIEQGVLFEGATLLVSEPTGRAHSRLDFLLQGSDQEEILVEVKSATIAVKGVVQFPDSVSPRATQHVRELARQAKKGRRAALVFLVQRGDVRSLRINVDHDQAFTRALSLAKKAGVEFLALMVTVSPQGFRKPMLIPVLSD